MIHAKINPTYESWRATARSLLQSQIDPAQILWTDADDALPFLTSPPPSPASPLHFTVPPKFLSLAKTVSLHRDPIKWSLLFRILHRLTHGQPHLLEIVIDDDIHLLNELEKSIRRDIHKMHAFVRFRKITQPQFDAYIAFHRPDHFIMPVAAPWFAKRFAVMNWTILTPLASASWDTKTLHFGPGVPASPAPHDDIEDLWQTYYANIFNPARIKIRAMKKEMPTRHWPTLPETRIIDQLLKTAPARVEEMMACAPKQIAKDKTHTAAEYVPNTLELPVLRAASKTCKGCDLYCNATQTVFGQGPAQAIAMFVGEQPGDQEDLAGKPFVGPAGQLLDQILEETGIDRTKCYVTNAVKHFKFELRGKRRIHSKPNSRQINACRPWLKAEISSIKPRMIIALGATAAQSMMGPQFRITTSHGKVFTNTPWSPWWMATIHPSALLRIPDPKLRQQSKQQFIEDLSIAAKAMRSPR